MNLSIARSFYLLISVFIYLEIGLSQEISTYTIGDDVLLDIAAETPGVFIGSDPIIGSVLLELKRNRIENRAMVEYDLGCPSNTNSPINMWTLGVSGDDIMKLSRYRFLNGHSSVDALLFSSDLSGSSFVTVPSHAKLRFGNEAVGSSIQGNGLELVIDAFVLTPVEDNTTSLGNSTNRFKEVYTVNGVITTSDARLKHHVKDITYGLKEVLELNPVEFTWKNFDNYPKQLGLIAQEVLDVIPEAVVIDDIGKSGLERKTNHDIGPMGIRYNFLIPVLIKAIQEQQVELDRLKEEARRILEG